MTASHMKGVTKQTTYLHVDMRLHEKSDLVAHWPCILTTSDEACLLAGKEIL